jgi:hypothetical protein
MDERFRISSFCGGGGCVGVAVQPDGRVLVADTKDAEGPRLAFTAAEWSAFLAGVRNGEFDLPPA